MVSKTKILILLILLIATIGCSRTVTTLLPAGDELIVRAAFRENIDYVNNRYFMIISTLESYSIPLGPPNTLDEFMEPGTEPQIGSLEAYYTNYYSTWHSYIIVDTNGYSLVNGPFVYNTETTKETFKLIDLDVSSINFNLPLSQIFGNSLPEKFYFDIISVEYPSAGLKYLKDKITPPNYNITINRGAVVSGSGDENADISGSLDILDWEVLIE